MHKQMLARHLNTAMKSVNRAVKEAEDKYGNNHIMTTTLKMEQKELADYISKLELETETKPK